MRKLYFQIYLGVIASLALLVVLAGTFWHFQGRNSPPAQMLQTVRDVIVMVLPAPNAPKADYQAVLEKLARPSLPSISLYSADLKMLAYVGAVLPPPDSDMRKDGWMRRPGPGSEWVVHLPDGRWLLAQPLHKHPSGPFSLVLSLGLIGLVVSLVAFPVARRLTRRLEKLKQGVEALGEGDFKARVSTQGCDEVTSLARSFNLAAERIETLLAAHKQLLANASHELRSPLTRIRLALEMHAEKPDPKLVEEIRLNIAELDQLIEEILLASRLDTMSETLQMEPFDLSALLVEESARINAQCDAVPLMINGDAKMLRRLLRNLLENARRHGGKAISARLYKSDSQEITIRIEDDGAGIPEAERERIFEPFYRPTGSREKEGSHGLGLALVKQIAEHHHGAIRYVPASTGSCFEVRLPLG